MGCVGSTWEPGAAADEDGEVCSDEECPTTGFAVYMPCIRMVVDDCAVSWLTGTWTEGSPEPLTTMQEGSRGKVDVMPGVSSTRLSTAVGISTYVPSVQNVDVTGK